MKYVITALDLEEYDSTYDAAELPLVTRFANISVYENPDVAAASAPLETGFQVCRQPGAGGRNCWPVRLFSHHGQRRGPNCGKGGPPELEELFGVVGNRAVRGELEFRDFNRAKRP